MAWFKCVGPIEGGGLQITPKEYAKFSRFDAIFLPIKVEQSTDKIEFEFYHITTKTYDGLIGGTQNLSNHIPLWINSNSRLQFYNYQMSTYTLTTGYHKFIYDPTDSSITIDNDVIATGISITALTTDISYTLGCRYYAPDSNANSVYCGYIKSFKVTDTSNNKVRCNIVSGDMNGLPVMFDNENQIVYSPNRLITFDLSTLDKVTVVTKSTGGYDASITLSLYDSDEITLIDTEDVLYTSVPNEASAFEFGPVKLWYDGYASKWYLKAIDNCIITISNNSNTFSIEDPITNWAYNSSIDLAIRFDNPT